MNSIKLLPILVALLISACSDAQTGSGNKQKSETKYRRVETKKTSKDFGIFLSKLSELADTSHIRRFEKEIILFEIADSATIYPKDITLFVGSSSIRKWYTLDRDMTPNPVINRGFGGSTLAQAIYYFPRIVTKYHPKQIVLYEGDNDLSTTEMTAGTFLQLFELFVEIRDEYLPGTQLFFLSIKPSPARMTQWEKMDAANQLVKKYAEDHDDIGFIDISQAMFDEQGKLKKEFFARDRLHLSPKGYALWTSLVKPLLFGE